MLEADNQKTLAYLRKKDCTMETLQIHQTLYAHLECAKTGEVYTPDIIQTYSRHHQPLVAKYHLRESQVSPEDLRQRPLTMWRYREFLPVRNDQHIVSLGEGMTPLIPLPRLAKTLGLAALTVKDEALNPTGSFKSRGLAMAVSKAKELGVRTCVIPTAGNAGGALAAYCARAGMQAIVYMPEATPGVFRKECQFFGAEVHAVPGTIADCAARLKADWQEGWFDVSTLKEPFRLEGKKTMGYEIAEQGNWQLPDVIIYPTGGGTGLIGIWKAFQELLELGWIKGPLPRMVAVQTEGCDPIVSAFRQKAMQAPAHPDPAPTIANGLRVPKAFGDRLILQALYDSKGTAMAVSEKDMREGIGEVAAKEGLLLAPEGAALWKACIALRDKNWIQAGENVMLINTGSMYKYMENV
jgi:threonine synthase